MTMRRAAVKSSAIMMLVAAALTTSVTAQKGTSAERTVVASGPARIWQDPGDVASLDLTYGAGGRAHAPDVTGTFTFVKEDASSSNPKFDVVDGQGTEWRVKLGKESRSETAATRFLWAVGYFVDEDYYLAEMTVKGLPTLRRGQRYVSADGIVRGARLERKPTSVTKLGDWGWFDNPFVGQRELNGLRVMMSLLNNWDLKQVNNSIYAVDGERRYVVSDVGATFGKTGSELTRSRDTPGDYERSKFVSKIRSDGVDFVLHARPFFLYVFAVPRYRERAKIEKVARHIPSADAKWLGQWLSKLTDDQIRDGFRSAGYGAGDVETLTKTIRRRVAALEAL